MSPELTDKLEIGISLAANKISAASKASRTSRSETDLAQSSIVSTALDVASISSLSSVRIRRAEIAVDAEALITHPLRSAESAKRNQIAENLYDEEQEKAARKLQEFSRVAICRNIAQNQRDMLILKQSKEALVQEEFVLTTGEILRNTIFNLMQEALYDEFHPLSDPIKFFIKE